MRLSASLLALALASNFALAQPQTSLHLRHSGILPKTLTKNSLRSNAATLAKAEAPAVIAAAAAPVREWVAAFNNTAADSDDVAFEMALDASGNVYVAGYSFNASGNADVFTIKYNNAGARQWTARYNGPAKGDDLGYALAVDALGNVYVAGTSVNGAGNDDAVTLKYNSAGVLQWAARYDGAGAGDDAAFDLQLDHAGNVYIGGYTQVDSANADLLTIKYDAAGAQQWLKSFHGLGSDSSAISELAVDAAQNVYVTGFMNGPTHNWDFVTIKYNAGGSEQWSAFYNAAADSVDYANAIALDQNGNVYVAGASINASGNADYAAVKYDSLGVKQWVARYNAQANGWDEVLDLAVDAASNVYVTGGSFGNGGLFDFATLKYDNAGVRQWVSRYNAGANGDDVAQRLLLDLAGNVYVAGYSMSTTTGYDYAMIGYDNAGVQQWVVRHNGTGNGPDVANDIALDRQRNLYVTGAVLNTNGNYDFSTQKFSTVPKASCASSAKLFAVEAQGPSGTQVYRYDVRPTGAPVLDLTLTHPSFNQPFGIAFDANHELFISNRSAGGSGSVSRFLDALGTPLFNGTIASPSFNSPHGMVFREDELFIAQNAGANTLRYRFGLVGEAQPNGAIASGASSGAVVSPWGELFVAVSAANEIQRYTFAGDGNATANGVIFGNGLGSPMDLTFSPWGELFVANLDSNSVSRFTFDPSYNAIANGTLAGAALHGPVGLSFSPWEELFVANHLGAGGIARWKFDVAHVASANGTFATPTTLGDVQFVPSNKILIVNAGTDKQIACTDSVQLGGSPSVIVGTAPFAYSWTPSTGLDNPSAPNPKAAPSAKTTYVLKVTDVHRCVARDTVVVNVTALTSGWSVQYLTDVDDIVFGFDQGQAVNPAPRDVEALALASNEKFLYLSYHLTHDKRVVRKIDLAIADAANNQASVVAQLQFPNGTAPINALATDDRGRVYISLGTEVRIYTANLATLLHTISGFSDCAGLATRRDNGKMALYATDRATQLLKRYELSEGVGEAMSGATKAGLDGDGEMFVPKSTTPRGIALQSNGLIWIADNGANAVIRLYANGNFRGITTVQKAHDLAIDASRAEIFVSQNTERTVKVLNIWTGQVKRTLTPPGASLKLDVDGDLGDGALTGIDVASCKRVFIANRKGRSLLEGNPFDSPFSNVGDNNVVNAADADPILVVTGNVLAKDEEAAAASAETATETVRNFELAQNYPNPFNPETKISFALPHAGEAKLSIFNETGQLVRTLVNRQLPSGRHELRWNGRNQNGEVVAAGIYLYRLIVTSESGEVVFSQTNRMTMVK